MFPERGLESSGANSSAPVVMVVEDEFLIRMGIAEYLRSCGLLVLEAASAKEAQVLLFTGVAVDIVFSDINMPNRLDGIELAQWIEEHYPHIGVVLTSGVYQTLDEAKRVCGSIKAFVGKPYEYTAVEQILREHAQDGRRQAGG